MCCAFVQFCSIGHSIQYSTLAVLLSGYTPESFDWNNYQKLTKFFAAPKSLFSNTQVAVSWVTCFYATLD